MQKCRVFDPILPFFQLARILHIANRTPRVYPSNPKGALS